MLPVLKAWGEMYGGLEIRDVPIFICFYAGEPFGIENICLFKGYLRRGGGVEGAETDVVVEVFVGESDGGGGDVDAVDKRVGDLGVEEGVQEEGDAACAGAEVEDLEGWGEGRRERRRWARWVVRRSVSGLVCR